jgi:hypothetical protein
MKRVLFQADDYGCALGANRAIRQTVQHGVVRSVGLMMPGLAAEDGMAELVETGACLGLHAVLNAEWDAVKWGPVSPAASVPSLVDENGYFWATPQILHDRGFRLDDVVTEVRAQLAKAQHLGLPLTYLDEHMGFGWLPGVRDALAEIAAQAGLLHRFPVPYLRVNLSTLDPESLVRAIDEAPEPDLLSVAHPCLDGPESRAWGHAGLEPGAVARERQAETDLLSSPALRHGLEARRIQVTDWRAFR